MTNSSLKFKRSSLFHFFFIKKLLPSHKQQFFDQKTLQIRSVIGDCVFHDAEKAFTTRLRGRDPQMQFGEFSQNRKFSFFSSPPLKWVLVSWTRNANSVRVPFRSKELLLVWPSLTTIDQVKGFEQIVFLDLQRRLGNVLSFFLFLGEGLKVPAQRFDCFIMFSLRNLVQHFHSGIQKKWQ